MINALALYSQQSSPDALELKPHLLENPARGDILNRRNGLYSLQSETGSPKGQLNGRPDGPSRHSATLRGFGYRIPQSRRSLLPIPH